MILERSRVSPLGLESYGKVSVSREDGWLCLDLAQASGEANGPNPIPSSSETIEHRQLALNAHLPGQEKFCLSADGMAHVRVDLLTGTSDDDCEDRIQEGLAALGGVMAALHGSGSPASPKTSEVTLVDVAAICSETGWSSIERGTARWMVELEGTQSFSQAEINLDGPMLDVAFPLLATLPEEPVCREAQMHLLLLATGAFRMIRCAVTRPEPGQTAGARGAALLIARIPSVRAKHELPHALSAMSLAARQVLREAQALGDPSIAGDYLALHRPTSLRGHTT